MANERRLLQFVSPQTFFCFLRCCYSSSAECTQDQLFIGAPYLAYENFHRTYVVLILPLSTFFKLNVCSALETLKLKNASASLKVPAQPQRLHASLWTAGDQYMGKTIAQLTYHRKASISYEFTVRSHTLLI